MRLQFRATTPWEDTPASAGCTASDVAVLQCRLRSNRTAYAVLLAAVAAVLCEVATADSGIGYA